MCKQYLQAHVQLPNKSPVAIHLEQPPMQELFIPKGRTENECSGHWRDLDFKILRVTKLQPLHKTLVPLMLVPNLLLPSAGLRSICLVPAGKDGIWRQEMTTEEEPSLNKIHLWAVPTHTHLSLLLLAASLNSLWPPQCYMKCCASCTPFIFHVGLYLI